MGNMTAIKAGFGIKNVLSFIFFALLLIFLFAKPISVFYNTRDISLAGLEVGRTMFLTSSTLAEESLYFSANPLFETNSKFTLEVAINIFQFLASIGLVFLWIRICTWLWIHTPFSTQENSLLNYIMGFFIFWFTQVIFLLGNGALNNSIVGITGENSISYYILLPITSLILFFKALPALLSPFGKVADKILEVQNNSGVK